MLNKTKHEFDGGWLRGGRAARLRCDRLQTWRPDPRVRGGRIPDRAHTRGRRRRDPEWLGLAMVWGATLLSLAIAMVQLMQRA